MSAPPSMSAAATSTSSLLAAQCSGVSEPGSVPVVGVGAGRDEQPNDLRAVGKVAGPVSHDVQRRTGFEATTQRGSRDLRSVGDDPPDCIDVAGVNGGNQGGGRLVIADHGR